jgi:tRNA threonylcarbamoyladenosine biosynthesis protein TsaE
MRSDGPGAPAAPGELPLADVAATHALATRLGAGLGPGDVLALVGELGAGKTELVRGLAAALDVPSSVPVSSPSYLLLNLYEGGRLPLAHFDAYFMGGPDDLERAGLLDLRREGWLVVVEWADRVSEALPPEALWVELLPGADAGARVARLGRGRVPEAPR